MSDVEVAVGLGREARADARRVGWRGGVVVGIARRAGEAPPGWEAKIYHATLKVGDTAIMGNDMRPDQFEPPRGFSIILQTDDAAAAERIFHEMSAGGSIGMPLQETFWAARFATWIDRFGIPWSINCERETGPV